MVFFDLDIKTMIIMVSVLSLLLSALLLLAGLHNGGARGSSHWALANLLISVGLGVGLTNWIPRGPWVIVFGATMLAAGMGLQYAGIQKFKRELVVWPLPLAAVVLVFCQTLWFHVVEPDPQMRAILNSLIYAAINMGCARLLLIPAEMPLKTAYRFTGISFMVLSIAFLYRAGYVYMHPPDEPGLYASLSITSGIFFIGSMTQMCLTFGFVLLLNYRLVTDLQKLAVRDPLTGILNRRSLEENAGFLLARCERNKEVMSLMMIDIDHFKSVNDQYGHQTGDDVLVHLVKIVNNSIRTGDYFARYGGEEFCVMLPLTTQEDALVLAERLRQKYAESTITSGTHILHSTLSIGLTDTSIAGLEFRALVSLADQALYRAKQTGRNRVEMYANW